MFAFLQSSFHDLWSWRYGTTNLSLLSYSPAACLLTLPLPLNLSGLESIGERYREERHLLMQARGEGLTKIYNRFHKPTEQSPDITQLRTLHVEMDQAVASAYGWSDLDLGHGFHVTKQGIRYTLSESARREVLDRLLALNHQRYAEELAAGLHEKKSKAKKTATAKTATQKAKGYEPPPDLFPPAQPDLFG